MCKVHSEVTYYKTAKCQKYFHHINGRGYNTQSLLYPRALSDENTFAVL